MDEELYQQLMQHLKSGRINDNLSNREKRKLLNKSKYFKEIKGQLYKKPKRGSTEMLKVIRKSEFENLMKIMHNHLISGHMGINTTYNKIKERYYWNQMYDDIKEYIKTCDTCQRFGKPERNEILHSIEVGQPFERIGIDIVGPLPETTSKNKYIVVATEYLTKWPEAKALDKANAENVAEFIYEYIICRHGTPKTLLTDQGSHFRNKLVEELCSKFEIKHRFSSPYHPQTNGLTERFNKILCDILKRTSRFNVFEWDKNIPSALFAYRTTKHSTTKFTPFYLNYGRKPILPNEVDEENQSEINEIDLENTIVQRMFELEETLSQDLQKARNFIKISQQKSQGRHNLKIKKKIEFKEGDKVLLYDSKQDKQWSGKLDTKWKGPFLIEKRLSKGSYILNNQFGKQIREPIHSDRLKMYKDKTLWEPLIKL